jgi:hypothetical protein
VALTGTELAEELAIRAARFQGLDARAAADERDDEDDA